MPQRSKAKRQVENREWTRTTFAKSRPASTVLPGMIGSEAAADLLKPRGRPKIANPKVAVSLRLPPYTLAQWRSTGPGWQTRMVETLERAARAFRKRA